MILILLIIPAGYLYAQPNLITNGDFETGDLSGWNHVAFFNASVNCVNKYADFSFSPSMIAGAIVGQDVNVPTKNLDFCYSYKTVAGTGTADVRVNVWLTPFLNIQDVISQGSSDDGWTTVCFNVPDRWQSDNPGTPFPEFSNIVVQLYAETGHGGSTAHFLFDNLLLTPHIEQKITAPAWVRLMPMTCYRVWINADNNFQFLFWYPYKNNNWVKIYAMNEEGTAGEEVFKVDMPYSNPNLIVDLPDGMYIVKTYHSDKMIQEFVIGKP
jgi:hypothetical protein